MCNEAVWDTLISSMLNKKSFKCDKFSVSYMLAGEGSALGVSNSDPYATEPEKSDDWVKEGPTAPDDCCTRSRDARGIVHGPE
jgi:hypothetical protein